jgi:hypothetical protein
MDRNPRSQAGGWTTAVMVGYPFAKDRSEVSLVDRDRPVQTLPILDAVALLLSPRRTSSFRTDYFMGDADAEFFIEGVYSSI